MKYVVRALLALAGIPLLAMAPGRAAAQQPAGAVKVAFVNMQRILSETPGYAQAESTLATENASYRTEVQQMQARLDSMANALQEQGALLSPQARQARRQALETQQTQAQQRFNDLQQKAAQRQEELVGPVYNRAVAVVEKLRQDGGYAIVFDVSSQGSAIVTADRALDLSDKAIAALKTPSN
jgi:outer membrane protein